ncbi:hypothetical protein A3K63_02410 [Candidatus Micrarchaeota archaeon RBG_16_49_10]|nr:MAG: hypothetical protein A3K63_02410 [Candidatus Micrarchaeota archaeon RBG_16_49_10]
MKILVTFYSRTGNTRKIGNEIAEKLKADADEVVDKKPRGGVKGYLFAGRDAMKKKLAEIEYRKDPAEYDLVIIGIPVWAGMVAPAIRTYLSENSFKNVAFFCSCGGGQSKTFGEMESLSKRPLRTLEITSKEVTKNSYKEMLKDFCNGI